MCHVVLIHTNIGGKLCVCLFINLKNTFYYNSSSISIVHKIAEIEFTKINVLHGNMPIKQKKKKLKFFNTQQVDTLDEVVLLPYRNGSIFAKL